MKIRLSPTVYFVVVSLVALGLRASAQSGAGPCACSDLNNIMNRMNRVAVISELLLEIWHNTPENEPYTNDAKEKMNQDINGQGAQINDPYPANYTGTPAADTTAITCTIELPGKDVSACIVEGLRQHELVHQKACLIRWALTVTLGPAMAVRWATMRQYINEDLRAYAAETQFLRQQAKKLACSCPYYAVHVQTSTEIRMNIGALSISGQSQAQNGTVDGIAVPLTFAGTHVSGTGTGTIGEAGLVIPMAQPQYTVRTRAGEPLSLDVEGEVDPGLGPESSLSGSGSPPMLHLEIVGTPGNGAGTETGAAIRGGSRTFALRGDQRSFQFDLQGYVESEQTDTNLIPVPGVTGSISAKIVEQKEKAAMTAAENWPPGTTPAKHFLPVCDAVKPP